MSLSGGFQKAEFHHEAEKFHPCLRTSLFVGFQTAEFHHETEKFHQCLRTSLFGGFQTAEFHHETEKFHPRLSHGDKIHDRVKGNRPSLWSPVFHKSLSDTLSTPHPTSLLEPPAKNQAIALYCHHKNTNNHTLQLLFLTSKQCHLMSS